MSNVRACYYLRSEMYTYMQNLHVFTHCTSYFSVELTIIHKPRWMRPLADSYPNVLIVDLVVSRALKMPKMSDKVQCAIILIRQLYIFFIISELQRTEVQKKHRSNYYYNISTIEDSIWTSPAKLTAQVKPLEHCCCQRLPYILKSSDG